MRIKITSDSTCDLSPRQIAENDITIIPLIVMKDGQEFIDGVTIDKQRFYERLVESDQLPTTSQATPAAFDME